MGFFKQWETRIILIIGGSCNHWVRPWGCNVTILERVGEEIHSLVLRGTSPSGEADQAIGINKRMAGREDATGLFFHLFHLDNQDKRLAIEIKSLRNLEPTDGFKPPTR